MSLVVFRGDGAVKDSELTEFHLLHHHLDHGFCREALQSSVTCAEEHSYAMNVVSITIIFFICPGCELISGEKLPTIMGKSLRFM